MCNCVSYTRQILTVKAVWGPIANALHCTQDRHDFPWALILDFWNIWNSPPIRKRRARWQFLIVINPIRESPREILMGEFFFV